MAHVIRDLYHDVILCGRNLACVCAGVLLCVGVRAAPSCVHFVTVSLSPVRASSPVSGWGTHSLGHESNVLFVLNIIPQ